MHTILLHIKKLDPPRNITALVHSGTLEIQWVWPESCCSQTDACFIYELKINNEIKNLKNDLVYKYANIKPTSRYTIQIRTKHDDACLNDNDIWSDWSKPVVIDPEISSTPALNASVIICIALVLPMILLAIILVCKLQRLTEKLFPSIPNPSKKVQILLEKEDFNQVTPKQIEETAEILEVSG
ncbi:hypothetical protein HF521_012971 [Silurus meridionalis]|uniref:Uncharacterized protein n=1 Tax=Silurus meridionalis TaxID=175797 RepID=A0A8T0AEJ7_SILME|nr:hypothetical protein HF521_012971 [Silurus meridionalis]